MPPSQPCGVFHGRTEAFSASLVAQPLTPKSAAPKTSSQSQWTAPHFMSGSWMRRDHLVAFINLTQLPAGHDVRDAAILLHGADDDLSDQFAVAADEHLAVFNHTLFITDVQYNKIPFRIHHDHLTFEVSGQGHETTGANQRVQLTLLAHDYSIESLPFVIEDIDGVLILLDQGEELEDYLGRLSGGFVSGQFGLRGVAVLRGLGKLGVQIVGALDLRGGGVLRFLLRGPRISQLLLCIRKVFLRRGQIILRCLQLGLSIVQLGVITFALGNQRVDLLAHLKNIQGARAQRRKYGHNQTNAHQHGREKLNGYAGRVNASLQIVKGRFRRMACPVLAAKNGRSEEHTSETPVTL